MVFWLFALAITAAAVRCAGCGSSAAHLKSEDLFVGVVGLFLRFRPVCGTSNVTKVRSCASSDQRLCASSLLFGSPPPRFQPMKPLSSHFLPIIRPGFHIC